MSTAGGHPLPLSNAERKRRHRLNKLAKDGRDFLQKESQRVMKYYVKVNDLTEEEKNERRRKVRERVKRYRQKITEQVMSENVAENAVVAEESALQQNRDSDDETDTADENSTNDDETDTAESDDETDTAAPYEDGNISGTSSARLTRSHARSTAVRQSMSWLYNAKHRTSLKECHISNISK